MAVTFGKDGTIYCNTVRYNYKQARNLAADNNGAQSSGIWGTENAVSTGSYPGYKCSQSFGFSVSGSTQIYQTCPTPIAGHKYYGGFMYKTASSGSFSSSAEFSLYLNGTASGQLLFVNLAGITTNGNWVKRSGIGSLSSVSSGTWKIRIGATNTKQMFFACKVIVVDLTDTFGAGNEPTKEWCDNNIREWEVYTNYGTLSPGISNSNYTSAWTFSGSGSVSRYGYHSLNSSYEPREYMYGIQGNTGGVEQTLTNAGHELNTSKMHYAYVEQLRPYNYANESGHSGESFEFFYPVAPPQVGGVLAVNNTEFNGGGGMAEWKRASAYNSRTQWSNGVKYEFRVDFNNEAHNSVAWFTALSFLWANSVLEQYNAYNGTSIAIGGINKEWCDRWVDARSSPIIHIKNHKNTTIKFNTSYDIVCNDIEIRPELNKVIYDTTGTIKCKKLDKAQEY